MLVFFKIYWYALAFIFMGVKALTLNQLKTVLKKVNILEGRRWQLQRKKQ